MKDFSDSICNRISDILLVHQEDDDLSIAYNKNTIDIIGNEGRLYIKLFRDELQIPYIVFKNRRVGTGTAVVNECVNICRELGLRRIVVLGVLTEEMKLFCNKLKFSKVRPMGYYDNNDYELVV